MKDQQIHGTIEQLVAEEHELWEREAAGSDTGAAEVGGPEVVERYQQ